MKNLNESNVWTAIECINETLKKSLKNYFRNIGKNIPSSVKVASFFCSVIEGLKEKIQAVKLHQFNIFFNKRTQNNTTETPYRTFPNT
jgi:hypothetical protein